MHCSMAARCKPRLNLGLSSEKQRLFFRQTDGLKRINSSDGKMSDTRPACLESSLKICPMILCPSVSAFRF